MSTRDFHDPRMTEQRNPSTVDIDVATPLEIVKLLNREDRRVPEVVWEVRDALAATITLVESAFAKGHRLIYVGAGTSGRLGVLDAAECPPTFGTDPGMVIGVIAGGAAALQRSQEGAEDDRHAGERAVADLAVEDGDVVMGIAASGTTPFVGAALAEATRRGATTVLLTCTDPPPELTDVVTQTIVLRVGPEALTGSTRLKSGTATKLALNAITTGAMIRMGKAYGNLMVDLTALSEKLQDRGERIVMEIAGVSRVEARAAMDAASGSVKTAIVMVRRGVSALEAQRLLADSGGFVRGVIGDPPPISE